MRTTPLIAVTAALIGGAMLSAPAEADPVPATGGCYSVSQPTSSLVPGTGIAGQNWIMTTSLSDCSSPLLPGIESGVLTVSVPTGFLTTEPASGSIVWSNYQRSAISGTWGATALQTSTFAITSGPGAGHHLLLTGHNGHRSFDLTSALLAP